MNHEFFMKQALQEAKKANHVSPNPGVGCVIVKSNKVIAKGHTQKIGGDHAEINTIKKIRNKKNLLGAILYATLEPCNHHGRTPPCTEAIIKAGIKEVVIAIKDPNPKAKGGIQKLRKSGVKVVTGVLEKEAKYLHRYFLHSIENKKPYLIQKIAMTLDSKIWSKKQRRITGEKSLEQVHKLRNEVDAIMVGINTVLKDNPRLTCRVKGGKNPLRVILDSTLKIPLNANVLKDQSVLLFTTDSASPKKLQDLNKKKIEIVNVGKKILPKKVLEELHKREIQSILLEGGSTMNTSFAGLADEIQIYIAPKIFGNKDAVPAFLKAVPESFRIVSTDFFGEDLRIILKPK